MKVLNLTQLYLDLMNTCDVFGFEISSIKKVNTNDPTDALICFYPRDIKKIDIELVRETVKKNLSGEVKHLDVRIDNASQEIYVYLEFLGHETNWDKNL